MTFDSRGSEGWRIARRPNETTEQQRARMQEECRNYARINNPPEVVADLERSWARRGFTPDETEPTNG